MKPNIFNLIHQKIFFPLRELIAPFEEIIPYLPQTGEVLDIGCGYGILDFKIAKDRPELNITGVDLNRRTIEKAIILAQNKKNLHFVTSDITTDPLPVKKYQVIICFDFFHHIPYPFQEKIITRCCQLLAKNGHLIVKEINTKPKWKYLWNLTHDTIVTHGERIYCRPMEKWISLLSAHNLMIYRTKSINKGFFYPHILLIAKK
jgi:2-polyprenyl-3-methyl-5-hydroxy-6-metoxy-1,4-benzoquinol methylase